MPARLSELGIIGTLELSLLFFWYLSRTRSTPAAPIGQVLKSITPFGGGTFEASGVAHVAGTDGVLFVDNGKVGQCFWMQLDQNGKQVGPIKTVDLGVSIEDIEGITTDGKYCESEPPSFR